MIKSIAINSALVAAVMGASLAVAQETTPSRSGSVSERGGFPAFLPSPPTATLLRTSEVKTELKLEEAQTKKLDEINSEASRERAKLTEEYNAKVRELNKKTESNTLATLNDAQRRRAEQLQLQQQGIRALSTDAVAEKLGLTQEQRTEISKLTQRGPTFGGSRDRSTTAGNPNASAAERFQQATDEAAKRAAETRDKVMAILTAEQKAKWTEMTGETFKFPSRSRSFTRDSGRSSSPPARPDAEKRDQ